MGTPDFAIPSLRALAARHQVVGVFCQPDRPKGRSKQPVPCPVKQAAAELGLQVHQPRRIKGRQGRQLLADLRPDLIVVAAFGQLLSQEILDLPSGGCLNVHASLLPRWRGASPIHFAMKSGDRETGISIMRMELALDAGPVYSRRSCAIEPEMSRVDLEEKLAKMGAELLMETIDALPSLVPQPQVDAEATYAPIITREMAYARPAEQTAEEIANQVRAFAGWPDVYLRFRGHPLKILQARVRPERAAAAPGMLESVSKKSLILACAQGTSLDLLLLQPAGKKPQPATAFINGYRPQPGERLEAKDAG